MIVLQMGVLVLIALAGTAMALAYEPKRQVMVSGVFGGLLALFFFVFEAPDVALSQLVVGAVAYPLMVLLALARAQGVDEPPAVAADGEEGNPVGATHASPSLGRKDEDPR